jgi:predicted glycoside hydrolase/deacetylase ChbG (UPF0249 family)
MPGARFLIVNADDFGLSRSVNRGILVAHAQGIVTSASLMVRWPAAAEAAAAARDHPGVSLGLHFDFGEWTCRNGTWQSLYEVVDLGDKAALAAEAARQLDTFRRLVGRNPTHLDSHQHVHRKGYVGSLLADMAERHGIPLRHVTPGIRYCGDFYGQDPKGNFFPEILSVARFTKILQTLSPGWTELACHPGEGNGDELDTMYRQERARETQVLRDPDLKDVLADLQIELRSFADWAAKEEAPE